MSYYATPILYLNMGGEMLYVLQQRLQTQKISSDKTIQVMNDVIYALLNPKQLHIIFDKIPLMSLLSLRAILERIVLSSIMKLDDNSMNKLFDLMIMMVKYQLVTVTGPRELILSTLNHMDAIRDMAVNKTLSKHIDLAHELILQTYGQMSHKDIWQIRMECLQEIKDHNVRVSILLRLGMQNQDATFNRLIQQRYDEQYKERREVLENVKLLDYPEDDGEGTLGSLTLFGDRVTILGKNVYSSTYGRVHSSSSTSSHSLNQVVAVSNKSMRKELETLAAQLGKEETAPVRPFSLHLFTSDNQDRNMDCTPDNSKYDFVDEEGNLNDDRNQPVNEYKHNLVKNINSEFSDHETPPVACTEAMDLMNLLDVM